MGTPDHVLLKEMGNSSGKTAKPRKALKVVLFCNVLGDSIHVGSMLIFSSFHLQLWPLCPHHFNCNYLMFPLTFHSLVSRWFLEAYYSLLLSARVFLISQEKCSSHLWNCSGWLGLVPTGRPRLLSGLYIIKDCQSTGFLLNIPSMSRYSFMCKVTQVVH